jgi:geranylgeranyl pyrophosphate synthase
VRQRPVAQPPPLLSSALDRAIAAEGPCALDPSVPAHVWRRALAGPAAEFLSRPGKELRAQLVRAGWELAGGVHGDVPRGVLIAVELMHAGSLIVDDVEDDSDERRGAPALHRLVGVPIAINTGSWMYFWALAELDGVDLPLAASRHAHRAAIATMIRCHQGQALDLATHVADLEPADAPAVVAATTRLKTGALCRFAAELGALAAGAPAERLAAIAELGETMGIALQMLDDLGSVASPARRGKGLEDLRAGRPTWPWAWLAETIDDRAWTQLAARTRGGSPDDPGAADRLRTALAAAIEPVGRRHVRATLEGALEAARAVLGPSAAIERVQGFLHQMEARYG